MLGLPKGWMKRIGELSVPVPRSEDAQALTRKREACDYAPRSLINAKARLTRVKEDGK